MNLENFRHLLEQAIQAKESNQRKHVSTPGAHADLIHRSWLSLMVKDKPLFGFHATL
jgi:hypothetical protein